MVEYRLYYDDTGKIVCYTTEDLEGKYVVIDKITYMSARHDVRVIDNKAVVLAAGTHILKLIPKDKGTMCHRENILVIDETDPVYWDLTVYEN